MNTDYRIRTVVPFEHYFILNKDIRKFMKEVLSIKNIEIMNLGYYYRILCIQTDQPYISVLEIDSVVEHLRQQF